MYFYKEIRKKEEALAEQLTDWCMDGNDFVQKYLLCDAYFENTPCLYHMSENDFFRPFIQVCNDLDDGNLFIFAKAETSFLFDDEKIESKENNSDIISKLSVEKQNWFVWVIPNSNSYKNELQQYVDSYKNTENVHAKIVFWNDLINAYAKDRKNCDLEEEIKFTYETLNHTVLFFNNFLSARNEMKELLITSNSFNSSLTQAFRHPDNQSVLNLCMNSVETDLDSSVESKLNERIEKIKQAPKILLMFDDDAEEKALKNSVIKYFKKKCPSMIAEKKIEYIIFPKYYIEGKQSFAEETVFSGNDKDTFIKYAANSIQELEEIIEDWNSSSSTESLQIKKGVCTLREIKYSADVYLAEVFDEKKYRIIVE